MIRPLSITALLLAGCGSPDGAAPGIDPTDPCGAKGYSALLGAPLAAVTLPADLNTRILQPGSMATTDYVETRMNIEVDANGTIVGLSCG